MGQRWLVIAFLLCGMLAFHGRAVFAQMDPSGEQSARLVKVGDIIQFRDGSKGVVCHVNSDNPYTGWVVAVKDFNVNGLKMLPTNSTDFLQNMGGSTCGGSDDIGWATTYAVSSEEWPSIGYENTRRLLEHGSAIAQALAESDEYNFYNGWYIPDAIQLREWYALFPIIRDSVNAHGGNISNTSPGTSGTYWSSSKENNSSGIACMSYPSGQMTNQPPTTSTYRLRPVRDFNLWEAFVYWDSLAANGDTNNVMYASPSVTTTYTATVEYGSQKFQLTGTVLVREKYDKDTISDIVCKSAGRYSWTLHDNYRNRNITRTIQVSTMEARPEPYIYRDTLHADFGCDSIVTHKLWIIDNCEYIVRDTVCPIKTGESLHVHKAFEKGDFTEVLAYDTTFSYPTEPGMFEHHATRTYSTTGDAVPVTVYYYLSYYDTYYYESEDAVCANDGSYAWANHRTLTVPTTDGTYIFWDSLKTVHGCDSVYKLALTVKPVAAGDTSVTVCGSFTWYGETYTETPAVAPTHTFTAANGCDSVVTLHLTVLPAPKVTLSDKVVCHNVGIAQVLADVVAAGTGGLTYSWDGFADFVPSTQHSNPVRINIPDDPDACDAEYPVTLTVTQNGCSATATAKVRVESTIPVITPKVPLDSLIVSCDPTVNAPSVQDFVVNDPCAQNPEVTLRKETETVHGCEHSLSWVASYANTCHPAADVVVTYRWKETNAADTTAVVCDSLRWYGETLVSGGDYAHLFSGANACGCDSVRTLHLTVKQSTHDVLELVRCGSATWYSTTYTESGTYTREYVNSNGCPSVDTLKLTVYPVYALTVDSTVCSDKLPVTWNGVQFEDAGTKTVKLKTVEGDCDSVVTMRLTVNPSPVLTVTPASLTVCEGEEVTFMPSVENCGDILYEEAFSGVTVNNSGTITDISEQAPLFATANAVYGGGGNSIRLGKTNPYTYGEITTKPLNLEEDFVLTLSMKGWESSNLVPTRLVVSVGEGAAVQTDSVTLPGYTGDGQYEHYPFAFHAAGPDAVITIKAINEPKDGLQYTEERFYINHVLIQDNAACTLAWSDAAGNPVSASGDHSLTVTASETTTYTVTATTSKSCTTSQSVDLAVKKKSYGDTTVTVCGSFTWYGVEYTTVPDPLPTHTFTNAAGCDSVVTLHLTLNALIEVEKDTTVCGAFEWDGDTYTTSQTVKKTFTSSLGCDSVVTMEVTVNPNPVVALTSPEVCPNEGNSKMTATVTTATAADYAYTWSGDLAVGATVKAADQLSDTATLTIPEAPSSCGQTYTMNVKVVDGHGCEATATSTVSVKTPAKPTIRSLAAGGDLGCNPSARVLTVDSFDVEDECDATAVVTLDKGDTVKNECLRQLTWTATYTNVCGLAAEAVSVTYTWTEDTEKPVIAVVASSNPNGACNPTITAPTFKVNDNCAGEIALTGENITTTGPTGTGCQKSQTWKANYTDPCGNKAEEVSVTYTWTEDTGKPVIAVVASSNPNGACNPTITAPTFKVNDNCAGEIALAGENITTTGPTGTGCQKSQTWKANYTDPCGNKAEEVSVTYTWTVDTEKPVIAVVASSNSNGACNPTITAPTFKVNDNCAGEIALTGENITTTGPTGTGCQKSQTWKANYTDPCGNAADEVSVTYTWTVDTEKPVIAVVASSNPNGACNPTIVAPTFKVNDNCAGEIALTGENITTTGPTGTGCQKSQTWKASYTDPCGNAADEVTVTYTWTEDTGKPVITASAADHDFECEPALGIPTFTVADDCEGIFTLPADSVTDGGVISTGTYTYSHTWTAHYTDACGNHAADKSVTYTWTVAPEVTITCPPDHYDTLAFGDCVMNIYPEQIGIPTINAPSDWPVTVSNDIPEDYLFQEGETVITWVATDPVCGNSVSCEQKVIVVFPKCPDAVDCEGNVYHGVRIDCDCWTQTNLVSNCYGDANECVETGNCDDPIPCVFEYESGFHPNVDENVAIYGKLYCDTAGVGDSTVNEHGHIQGICPEGWYLPTVEKYADLFLHGDALKSPLYWTDGGGDNSTGFSWLPAGWYNGALQRFEGMGSEGYFLAVETTVEGFRTVVFTMQHDCDEVKRIETHQGFGYSVRCVKEKD